jgi:hypothetical protein
VEKGNKRLDVWKGGTLLIAGRSTLISASLNNSPMYHMSVYLLPKTTVLCLDKIRRTFFWQGVEQKRNIILLNGKSFVRAKRKVGWGLRI